MEDITIDIAATHWKGVSLYFYAKSFFYIYIATFEYQGIIAAEHTQRCRLDAGWVWDKDIISKLVGLD